MVIQDLTEDEFRNFQELIYSKSGIRVPATKRTLLSNRIRRRLKAGEFSDFESYYRHVISPWGQGEIEGFLDAVTTNETSFFRTEKHFEWFQTEFITEMIHQARRDMHPKQIRVWSAACSSGEEPYSLAICLARNSLRLRGWSLKVVGTDISEQMLKQARKGVYRDRSLKSLDGTQRRRYFKESSDGYCQIQSAPRDLVEFHFHNLMKPMHLPPFDCIFLRNVMIYFDRDSKQKVVHHLVKSLDVGGYLVLGPSEGVFDMLGMLKKHSPFLYQKLPPQ